MKAERLYRIATWAATPLVRPLLERRRRRGKEDAARLGERLGEAAMARPAGRLLWIHGASVGEAQSVLGLIRALMAAEPGLSILITTGTVTSAGLMAQRLPEGAFHQFVPVDHPRAVRRFLDHWRPDAALWVESELWPNLVLDTARRGVPMALINGRMSEGSFARWQKRPKLIGALLGAFRFVAAQSAADADRFTALGAADVRCLGNLKLDAPALGADAAVVSDLALAFGERPRWVAISTHRGEETRIAEAHRAIADFVPGLLTIVVPRHPERGGDAAADMADAGLRVARRRSGDPVTGETDVYIADTLGELGVFCRLAQVVLVGGSLVPHGGQNPLEPARLGCAIIAGPHMGNFAEVMEMLRAGHAVADLARPEDLATVLARLLTDPDEVAALSGAALAVAAQGDGVVGRVMDAVRPLLTIGVGDARP